MGFTGKTFTNVANSAVIAKANLLGLFAHPAWLPGAVWTLRLRATSGCTHELNFGFAFDGGQLVFAVPGNADRAVVSVVGALKTRIYDTNLQCRSSCTDAGNPNPAITFTNIQMGPGDLLPLPTLHPTPQPSPQLSRHPTPQPSPRPSLVPQPGPTPSPRHAPTRALLQPPSSDPSMDPLPTPTRVPAPTHPLPAPTPHADASVCRAAACGCGPGGGEAWAAAWCTSASSRIVGPCGADAGACTGVCHGAWCANAPIPPPSPAPTSDCGPDLWPTLVGAPSSALLLPVTVEVPGADEVGADGGGEEAWWLGGSVALGGEALGGLAAAWAEAAHDAEADRLIAGGGDGWLAAGGGGGWALEATVASSAACDLVFGFRASLTAADAVAPLRGRRWLQLLTQPKNDRAPGQAEPGRHAGELVQGGAVDAARERVAEEKDEEEEEEEEEELPRPLHVAPGAGSCRQAACGCGPPFLEPWCDEASSVIADAWCNEAVDQCTAGCGGAWCLAPAPTRQPAAAPVKTRYPTAPPTRADFCCMVGPNCAECVQRVSGELRLQCCVHFCCAILLVFFFSIFLLYSRLFPDSLVSLRGVRSARARRRATAAAAPLSSAAPSPQRRRPCLSPLPR